MTAGDAAALWGAVLAIGAYHGLNPAMGWPLAVAAGLSERRGVAVFRAFVPLALGHLLAMAVVLLPFALGLCARPVASALAPAAAVGGTMLVAAAHTLAMMSAGLAAAWAVYRWLGLRALTHCAFR